MISNINFLFGKYYTLHIINSNVLIYFNLLFFFCDKEFMRIHYFKLYDSRISSKMDCLFNFIN